MLYVKIIFLRPFLVYRPQPVQSGTTAVGLMRQKTEVDLPLKPHTAPSLGPVRSSLPNRGIVKGKYLLEYQFYCYDIISVITP